MRPWHAHDIYIPKLPKRAADGAYLTLTETHPGAGLVLPFAALSRAGQAGITVEDNDPDIIRATRSSRC